MISRLDRIIIDYAARKGMTSPAFETLEELRLHFNVFHPVAPGKLWEIRYSAMDENGKDRSYKASMSVSPSGHMVNLRCGEGAWKHAELEFMADTQGRWFFSNMVDSDMHFNMRDITIRLQHVFAASAMIEPGQVSEVYKAQGLFERAFRQISLCLP